jgi:hypothetical protein
MVGLYQVAHQEVFRKKEHQLATMITAPGGDINTRAEYVFNDVNETPNTITCLAGGEEMIRVGPDGFWVRGIKVKQDDNEAQAVYNAFKQWMAWTSLGR